MTLRQPAAGNNVPVRAITFDCWGTLMVERDTDKGYEVRVNAVHDIARDVGIDADSLRVRQALDLAWSKHWELWCDGIGSGARENAAWSLHDLGVEEGTEQESAVDRLTHAPERGALQREVVALEGAALTLQKLASLGVRLALICDTGFSPGHIVRELLDRVGLLDSLEVQIFSDEAGVPKPHADVFHAALEQLGVEPQNAVHVGDLRHTDIKGARAIGMGTVRINDHHDDQTALPDADAVSQSHAELRTLLGIA